MNYIYFIPIVFLALLSILDIKTFHLKDGFIPSFITTTAIIVSFLLNQSAITFIFALLIAILLFDLEFYEGLPDIKCFLACGAILPNIFYIVMFGAVLAGLGFIYKFVLKRMKFKEIPFIPVIGIAYIGALYLTPAFINFILSLS